MTRQQAQQIRELFNAFCDGKTIQYRSAECYSWADVSEPYIESILNFTDRFRIKPEPKLRPLNPQEMRGLVGKVLEHKRSKRVDVVQDYNPVDNSVKWLGTVYYSHNLLELCVYADTGKPVGVEE